MLSIKHAFWGVSVSIAVKSAADTSGSLKNSVVLRTVLSSGFRSESCIGVPAWRCFLADQNCNGTEPPSQPEAIEFNWPLYVYKRRARDDEEYLYTIAVWKGTTLMPICHLQPLETAMAALREGLSSTELKPALQ